MLWIGGVFATDGAMAVLLPCGFLWLTLYGLGTLNERGVNAIGLERARLWVGTPLFALGMIYLDPARVDTTLLVGVTGGYILASAVALGVAGRPLVDGGEESVEIEAR